MSSEHFHHSKEGDDWSDTSSRSEKQVSYEVERIIAETEGPEGQPVYLVKWKGYKDYRSTWEPASSFETPGKHWTFFAFHNLVYLLQAYVAEL